MHYNPNFKSPCYAVSLDRASNTLNAFYDNRLKSAGISVKQFSLLINLSLLDGASTVELSNTVNLDRTTITRNLKSLLNNGWICDTSETGKRAHRYIVTELGKKQLEISYPIWKSAQKDFHNFLGEENTHRFMEILRHIQSLPLE